MRHSSVRRIGLSFIIQVSCVAGGILLKKAMEEKDLFIFMTKINYSSYIFWCLALNTALKMKLTSSKYSLF